MSQASSRTAEAEGAKPWWIVDSRKQRIVHLQVGARENAFVTTHHTLCRESTFFQALLSDHNQRLPSAPYFVDADPELFAHILRYLRHGILPVSFTPGNGHDLTTYLGIKRLATDLGIERLVKWVADKQYESAIECSVTFERVVSEFNTRPFPPRSYLSTDHVCFVPDSNGRIWEFKKRFAARPEAFLAEP